MPCFFRHAGPRISDFNDDTVALEAGPEGDGPSVRHGVYGAQEEIDEGFPQFSFIGLNDHAVFDICLEAKVDVAAVCLCPPLRLRQGDSLVKEEGKVDGSDGESVFTTAIEVREAFDDGSGVLGGNVDALEELSSLFLIVQVFRSGKEEITKAENGRQ